VCGNTQADSPESQPLLDRLNIEVLPTLQFFRDGKKLWEHRGIVELETDLGSGVQHKRRLGWLLARKGPF
jgi:hypothetical protein